MRSLLVCLLVLLTSCVADEPAPGGQQSGNMASESKRAVKDGGESRQLDTTTPVADLYVRAAKRAEAEGNAPLAATLYRAANLADKKDVAPRAASAELYEKVGEFQLASVLF